MELSKFLNVIKKDRFLALLLFAILVLSLFVRTYRLDELLGFYYDQGRDALVIWDFLHKGKMFLIGPTTGIEGIFRGPWYYWLIAPFYFLGGGSPLWPSVFLALTSVLALFFLFLIAYELDGKLTAFVALFIGSFSYYIVIASRWLSNPTPMLLISMLLFYSIILVVKGKSWAWLLVAFLLGQAMQFGSATEAFYFPSVILIALWKRKTLRDKKIVALSLLALLIAFIPQILFDLKHDGVLRKAIAKFLFEDQSFKLTFWEILKVRIPFYYDVFFSKIFPGNSLFRSVFLFLSLSSLVFNYRKYIENENLKMLAILIVSPMVGMLFFQGNYGNVYDYYFTGYYLIFVILFSFLLTNLFKGISGKVLIFSFLLLFSKDNIPSVKNYIVSGVDGPTTIAFGNQKKAIDWVYTDAVKEDDCPKFNIDSYVPPVISYSYDYLYKWYGTTKYQCEPQQDLVPTLYTLFEVDPPHPERLEAWLNRQKGIGNILYSKSFGGITVQKRNRTD